MSRSTPASSRLRSRLCRPLVLAGPAAVLGLAAGLPSARAEVQIEVTTTEDEDNQDGDCSLREAVAAATRNEPRDACPAGGPTFPSGHDDRGDVIVLRSGLRYTLAAPLVVTSTLGIETVERIAGQRAILDGQGRPGRGLVVAAPAGQTIRVDLGYLSIENFRGGGVASDNERSRLGISVSQLRNNGERGTGLRGGGVYARGPLWVGSSVVSGNLAEEGGGIYARDAFSTTGSVVSGNEADGDGGGLLGRGTISIERCAFVANRANAGGGIYALGPLSIDTSTLSGNVAVDKGGGLYTRHAAAADPAAPAGRLARVTVAFNRVTGAGATGGGVYVSSSAVGPLALEGSLLDENGAASAGADCQGLVASDGFNLVRTVAGCSGLVGGDLVGVGAQLAPLAALDHDAAIPAHLPAAGSPALRRVPQRFIELDQRFRIRRQPSSDAGAVDRQIGDPE